MKIQNAKTQGLDSKTIIDEILKQNADPHQGAKNFINSSLPSTSVAGNFGHELAHNTVGEIGRSFVSGVNQVKEGVQQASQPAGPVQGFESGFKMGAGVVNAALSPLAPVFKPVGDAINYVGDKISDNSTIQKFANSQVGQATSRAAEDVGNLSTIAGAVGGSKYLTGQATKFMGPRAIASTADALDELFNGTKSARNKFAQSTAQGKTPAQFGAENNYIPEIKDGKVNAQSTIQKVVSDAKPFEQVYHDILKEMDRTTPSSDLINLDNLPQRSKLRLQRSIARGTGTLPHQLKAINNLLTNLKQTYGETVGRTQLDEIRSGQWHESNSFNPNQPKFMGDVNYQIGKTAKTILADKTSGQPVANKILSRISDHYDYAANLKKVDGSAVKGGRLGKYFARTIGAAAGSSGGIVGTVAGATAGDYIASIMQDSTIANPLKRQILNSVPKDSTLYDSAQKAVGQMQYSQPALPAGAGSPSRGKLPTVNAEVINQPTKIHPLETGGAGVRSKIIRPTGVSQSQPVTQIFHSSSERPIRPPIPNLKGYRRQ